MEKEAKEQKAKRYVLAKGKTLELSGFPYPITEELLNGPKGSLHLRAIQNYEAERGFAVLGTLITLK